VTFGGRESDDAATVAAAVEYLGGEVPVDVVVVYLNTWMHPKEGSEQQESVESVEHMLGDVVEAVKQSEHKWNSFVCMSPKEEVEKLKEEVKKLKELTDELQVEVLKTSEGMKSAGMAQLKAAFQRLAKGELARLLLEWRMSWMTEMEEFVEEFYETITTREVDGKVVVEKSQESSSSHKAESSHGSGGAHEESSHTSSSAHKAESSHTSSSAHKEVTMPSETVEKLKEELEKLQEELAKTKEELESTKAKSNVTEAPLLGELLASRGKELQQDEAKLQAERSRSRSSSSSSTGEADLGMLEPLRFGKESHKKRSKQLLAMAEELAKTKKKLEIAQKQLNESPFGNASQHTEEGKLGKDFEKMKAEAERSRSSSSSSSSSGSSDKDVVEKQESELLSSSVKVTEVVVSKADAGPTDETSKVTELQEELEKVKDDLAKTKDELHVVAVGGALTLEETEEVLQKTKDELEMVKRELQQMQTKYEHSTITIKNTSQGLVNTKEELVRTKSKVRTETRTMKKVVQIKELE